MTQFNWVILNMPSYSQIDGKTDVVFEVNWQCQAISNDGAANSFGNVPVTYVAGSPFTPYDQLTQDQVWGWVNPQIDRPAIEANLQALIDEQKNPPIVTPPLPWNN